MSPQASGAAPKLAQIYPFPTPRPAAPTLPGPATPLLPGIPVQQVPPPAPAPAFPVPGQPIVPPVPVPTEQVPGEETPLEELPPPPPITPPPTAIPTEPVAPSTLRYIPVPPEFTFLRQDPTFSPFLEQNPLAAPQRVRFSLFAGAEYDSNRDLKTELKSSDVAGSATLATTVNLPAPRYFLTLANAITYQHSFRTGTSSLQGINLSLASGYSVSPRLSVALTDLFVRSVNSLQQTLNQPPGLFISTQPSTINTVAISSNYRLSPVSSLGFFLGNSIVRNDDPQLENSHTERAGLSFSTALLPKLSLGAGYSFSYTALSREPFLQTHTINGFAGYSLDSVTRLIVGGSVTARLRPGPDDSLFYGANFRIERRVYAGIVCFVGGGFDAFDTADQGVHRRFNYDFGCTGDGGVGGKTSALLTKNLTLDLDFRSQIRDTTDETVAVGLVNTQTASALLRYFPIREFLGTLRLSASRSQLFESTSIVPNAARGNTFYVLQGDLVLTYQINRWVSAVGTYTFARRLANQGTDVVDQRAFIGLSTGYGF